MAFAKLLPSIKERRHDETSPWSRHIERQNISLYRGKRLVDSSVTKKDPIISKTIELTGCDAYISSFFVVEKHLAKFAVHYPGKGPIINSRGEFLYFKDKQKAVDVCNILKDRYDVDSEIYHGPAASGGKSGRKI